MLFWLILAIVLYYVQAFLPATINFFKIGLKDYLGRRDLDPELAGPARRLDRASANMRENFPPFAALAVAALALGMGDNGQVILGAQIFVISRVLYVPLYALAVPVVRSLAAVGGWAGIAMIAIVLLGAA